MLHNKQKGHLERCPKLLILMVAWDRIELPTRGFLNLMDKFSLLLLFISSPFILYLLALLSLKSMEHRPVVLKRLVQDAICQSRRFD